MKGPLKFLETLFFPSYDPPHIPSLFSPVVEMIAVFQSRISLFTFKAFHFFLACFLTLNLGLSIEPFPSS